jgi:hypothetical protein
MLLASLEWECSTFYAKFFDLISSKLHKREEIENPGAAMNFAGFK